MDGVEVLLVVIAAIAVTSIAQRRNLQSPLVLVAVGGAISFIPGLPRLEISPEVILGFVLPPLLFSTAIDFSVINFIRNFRPILSLGVVLVVITAAAVGFSAQQLVPALTLPGGVLLGSVVAPPDAVTAVAIGRRLGLPKRMMTILTGESLVNDAAALTIFTVTLTAITGAHALIDNPLLYFGYAVVVGLLIGLLLSVVVQLVQRRLNNAGLETVLGLVLPFAAYLAAEELHASGVIAVVTAGFSLGHNADKAGVATRLQERYVWRSVDVLLEAFVFAYMGLQLRFVIDDAFADGRSSTRLVISAVVILLVVMAVRPAWIMIDHARLMITQKLYHRHLARDQRARVAAARRRHRARGRGPQPEERVLPLKQDLVISWTGMRGVVTLAAAAGIPQVTADGAPFAGRSEIQLIAIVVAVGTLLIQGLTLPMLINKLRLEPDDEAESRRQLELAQQVAREAAQQAAAESIENPRPGLDPAVIQLMTDRWQQMQQTRQRMQQELEENETPPDPQMQSQVGEAFGQIRLDMVPAQRKALAAERDAWRLDDDLYREMLEELDYDEASMASRTQGRLT